MRRTLNAKQLALLHEVVSAHCPNLIDRVTETKVTELTRGEREIIVEAIADEMAKSGFAENYEPNQKGLLLEDLLDEINRPNLLP